MQTQKACDFCRDLICAREFGDTLEVLARSIAQGLAAKGCSIELLNRKDRSLELAALFGAGAEFLRQPQEGPAGRKKQEADSLALRGEAISLHAGEDFFGGEDGIRHVLSVPLPSDRGVAGIIRVYSEEDRDFTPEEVRQALFFASMGGMLAGKAKAWDRMRALAESARSLSGTLSAEQVLNAIAEAVAKGLDAQGASVWTLDREQKTEKLSFAASYGLSDRYPAKKEYGTEESPLFKETLECRTVSIQDISIDSRVTDREELAAEGVHALISVPFAVRGSVLGVLQAYMPYPFEFGPEEVEFASGIACQGAIAMENARLFEHIKREYDELQKDVWKWYDWGERFPKRL